MKGCDLKSRREIIKMSIETIAEKFGIDMTTIIKWESETEEIPFPLIIDLAMKQLEDAFMWEQREPYQNDLIDRVRKAVHHADAVLAGVE